MNDPTSADPPDERPSTGLAISVFVLVCGLALIAALVYNHYRPELHLELKSFVILAPIYAAAQAIERLLEPLAAILHPAQKEKEKAKDADAKKTQTQAAAAAALASQPKMLLDEDSDAQRLGKTLADANKEQAGAAAKLARKQAERALIFFALSSFVALALCAAIGLGLITAMCETPPAPYIRAIDVALTGLIIGAGTKPLHDLISRVEKAKESAGGSSS